MDNDFLDNSDSFFSRSLLEKVSMSQDEVGDFIKRAQFFSYSEAGLGTISGYKDKDDRILIIKVII